MKPVNDINGSSSIQERLKENQLPIFEIGVDLSMLPQQDDYYSLLSEEEREEWEEKAEAFNAINPDATFLHTGSSLWREEGEEYSEFVNEMNALNANIENYLRAIDEKYGTEYCPTGVARFIR